MMRNPFAARRERHSRRAVLWRMAEAQKEISRSADPAGRAWALREFAAGARTHDAEQERLFRRDSGRCLWPEAAVLAETAAYSEQWLAEERLDGTLPGNPEDFGPGAELAAWERVFTETGAAARRRAYLDLADAAGQRTTPATVSVLEMLTRAYLVQMGIAAAAADPGVLVTVLDLKKAAS